MPIQIVDRAATAPEEQAARGDSEAFEEFYRAHTDRVYRALAITLNDLDLAREATDEAMARAYARWRRVRDLDNPGGWAYRVGLNWATSRWRRLRREHPLGADLDRPIAPDDDDPGAAMGALAKLSAGNRAVVVCRVLLDLSIAETAAVLGVPEGTVRSRLTRAISTLRTTLAREAQP